MTPIENAPPNSPESRYTQAHVQTRNCVERCIGLYKGRFLCLSKVLRYSPEKVGHIANACAILHNICVAGRLGLDFEAQLPPEDNNDIHIQVGNNPRYREGDLIRRNLLARYFRNI